MTDKLPPARLLKLLEALCEERISPAEFAELDQVLADPANRRHYVRYLDLHANLPRHHVPAPQLSNEPPSPPTIPAAVSLVTPRAWYATFSRPMAFSLLFATVCVASFVLTAVQIPAPLPDVAHVAPEANSPRDSTTAQAPPQPAARLIRVVGARWRSAFKPSLRQVLYHGEVLRLAAGAAEVQFDGGAHVRLTAPCELVIHGPNEGKLRRGQLWVNVPTRARGFTIDTPNAAIVDLGTEFGVLVDRQGRTEAHVLHGAVEIVSRDPAQPPERVEAGVAVSWTLKHPERRTRSRADRDRFIVATTPPAATAPPIPGGRGIGVDFQRSPDGLGNHGAPLLPDDVAGLVPQANWNEGGHFQNPLGGPYQPAVLDAQGEELPGVRIAWGDATNAQWGNNTPRNQPTAQERLLNDHFTALPDGTPLVVAVSGLPAHFTSEGFDLILYVDARNQTEYDTEQRFDLDLDQDGVLEHSATLSSTATRDFVDRNRPNEDFAGYVVRFDQLGRGGPGVFKLTIQGAANRRVVLSGMQIVPRLATPAQAAQVEVPKVKSSPAEASSLPPATQGQ